MLTLHLRDYQREVVDALDSQFAEGSNALVVPLPTGGGKTAIAAHLLDRVAQEGGTGWFLTHRIVLAKQTVDKFAEYGLSSGLLQAGNTRDVDASILVANVQTLQSRDHARIGKRLACGDLCASRCDGKDCATLYNEVFNADARAPDLLVIDEADIGYPYPRRVARLTVERGGKVIGLTATPYAAFMSQSYDGLVKTQSMKDLTDTGDLVPFTAWSTADNVYDMRTDSGRAIKPAGSGEDRDYTAIQIKRGFNADAVPAVASLWLEKTADLRAELGRPPQTLIVVPRIDVGRMVADVFTERTGYRFELTSAEDSRNGDGSTEAILARFDSGDTVGLVSVDKLGRGFDRTAARVLILMRPVATVTLLAQLGGRIVRCHDGKDKAYVLDTSGSFERLHNEFNAHYISGPDELGKPRPVGEGEGFPPRKCPRCGAVVLGNPDHCACGYRLFDDEKYQQDAVMIDASMLEIVETVRVGTRADRAYWEGEGLDPDLLMLLLSDPLRVSRECHSLTLRERSARSMYGASAYKFALLMTPIDHIECPWRGFRSKCSVAPTVASCAAWPDEVRDRGDGVSDMSHWMHPLLFDLLQRKRAIRNARNDGRLYSPSSVRCRCCSRYADLNAMLSTSTRYGFATKCADCRGSREVRCAACGDCLAGRHVNQFSVTRGLSESYCDSCAPW